MRTSLRRNRRIGAKPRAGSTASPRPLSKRLPTGAKNLRYETTADTAATEQEPLKNHRKPRGGWIVNRLRCLVRGHRQLAPTAAASKILANGVVKEINLCHACGSYVWRATNRKLSPSWAELQEWSTSE